MTSNASGRSESTAASQTSPYGYDLLVIGGGSGGLVAAKQAAKQGIKVGLIEANQLGGTCANRGCVPKKLMHYAAEFAHQATLGQSYGWTKGQTGSFHWKVFQEKMQEQLKKIRSSIEDSVEEAGVDLIRGRARFTEAHQLEVKSTDPAQPKTRTISAKNIVIAVGGQPIKLDIPGIELALTSRNLFKLEQLPKSLMIVGGGYIGVEFSGILKALGVEITLVDTDAMPLQNFDQALQEGVLQNLKEQGIRFVANASLDCIRSDENQTMIATVVSTQDGSSKSQEIRADRILVATGRSPNLEPLNLAAAGIGTQEGAIAVNTLYQTSQPHIYAVGDCIDRLPLTPVAQAEARCVIDQLYGEGQAEVDYRWTPSAVYAMPPAASVGWSESQAKENAEPFTCYQKEVTPLSHVLSDATPHHQIKWIVDKTSNKVLGLHVLGASAPDIVQSITPLLKRGVSHRELQQAMGIHPTFGEELFDS